MNEFVEENVIEENVLEEVETPHLTNSWEVLEFNMDTEYEYIPQGKIFSVFSNLLYYGIAMPILWVVNKLVYDLKIEGKESLKNLKSGAVSIANHVLFIDCSMVGLAWGRRKVYYTTLEESFKIPFVRRLIKLLGAVPIPKQISNKEKFITELNNALKKGKIVHLYPEASLVPYHTEIRNFKNGAFEFAVRNEVPVVPMVIRFREPQGIRKIFKRKKDVTLKILEPMESKSTDSNIKNRVHELKEEVYEKMKEALK